jgi:S-DNA-T family DNA segregation ATPase FtsK/SpoIIIE
VDVDLAKGPHFMIAGTARSGKTTLLQSWILTLAERYPPERLVLYLVDFQRASLSPLSLLPHVCSEVAAPVKGRKTKRIELKPKRYIADSDQFGNALAGIAQLLDERQQDLEKARQSSKGMPDMAAWLARYPAILMAIDDYDAFRGQTQDPQKKQLDQIIRRHRDLGLHVIAAGSVADFDGTYYDDLSKTLKAYQSGVLLGTGEDNSLFRLNLPYDQKGYLPAGIGFFVIRGQYRRLKVANPVAGTLKLPEWVAKLGKRATGKG